MVLRSRICLVNFGRFDFFTEAHRIRKTFASVKRFDMPHDYDRLSYQAVQLAVNASVVRYSVCFTATKSAFLLPTTNQPTLHRSLFGFLGSWDGICFQTRLRIVCLSAAEYVLRFTRREAIHALAAFGCAVFVRARVSSG